MFNLSQLYKGSGVSFGVSIRGVDPSAAAQKRKSFTGASSESRRDKTNAIWKAHQVIMNNVI